MLYEHYGFKIFFWCPPSIAKSPDETVVKGDVVTRRAMPLKTVDFRAMSERRVRLKKN